MQIAVRLAGYSMGEADNLRKAMGKKIPALLAQHREKFVQGCVGHGYEAKLAEKLFDLIGPFADYGFNASHACAYAYVGYQTAYLKCHHPVEYMSALLTSVRDDKDDKPFYLNAARLMNVKVLPPDVNESGEHFTPSAGDIRYGLAAVRNVGSGVVQQIIHAREEQGRFESFTDFCRKVEPGVLHKKVLESLILAGAFDTLGYTRRGLLEGYEQVAAPIVSMRRAQAMGQESLFGGEAASELVDIDESRFVRGEEFGREDLLRLEKEMLGQYVSDHPLLGVKEQLAAQTDREIVDVPALGDGDVVTVAGIVGTLARRFTKRGEAYAQLRLEDLTGGVGVVVFPSMFEQIGSLLALDRILKVRGRVDLRGRELQLVALEVSEPDLAGGRDDRSGVGAAAKDPLMVDVPLRSLTDGMIARLKSLLGGHPGPLPVIVRLVGEVDGDARRLRLGEDFRVDGSLALESELRRLLGAGAVSRVQVAASGR